ncbi:MAG TPA: helix-turn-helix domain-containing protein [Thermoplasmata archaeon]|nr:helix-turn-helix domain-containing protein [Thermoplasmata archaeon]HLB68019.1 helix-turn-helix domain-containing protein [Thermoplasmata archaeon]
MPRDVMPPEVSKLLETGIDLEKEYEKVARTLESIGLSSYEARGYVALVAHGFGSAETIAETARIPRTSAYKVLQSLCNKGFAISTRGRPTIFKPESPGKVKDRVIEHLEDTFAKLDLLHEVLRKKGEPQLVYTISSKPRVLEKIGELLETASETFMVSTPTFSEIRETLGKKVDQAMARGIKVTVITEPGQKIPDGATAVYRKGLIATDVIVDGASALIASPDLSACGYTDNASLSRHLENFLEIIMNLRE